MSNNVASDHATIETSVPSPAWIRALGWLIFRIDDRLRARQQVYEFSRCSGLIFRMQVRPFDQNITLKDTTRVDVGDRIVDLHLWNEHLPLVDDCSLRFARRMNEALQTSLCELASYMTRTPELDDIDVIRANMGFGNERQTNQLVRIAGSYGFESILDPRPATRGQKLHRFGENVLISLLVLARNGAALRRDTLSRARVQVFLSRRELIERYAGERPLSTKSRPTCRP